MKTRGQHAGEEALTIENLETIPIDLIIEILLRLPAKSIARCRCVSKLWASIILPTYFTELFTTRSWARPQILFSFAKKGEVFFFSTPQVRNPDENSCLVAGNHRMKLPLNHTFQTRVPLHGFVCLTHVKKPVPVICNPSTGQVIPLPKVKTRRVRVTSYLGFDPIGKIFKLLSVTCRTVCGEKMAGEHKVLTLGTPKISWRKKIKCCISYRYPRDYANGEICINGGLYYIALLSGPPKVHGIVCFDVRSEKFTVIKGAEGMTLGSFSTLVNYKGRLCIFLSDEAEEEVTIETECFELWVLVDAEKHEWSKHLYIVPPMWKNVVADAELFFVGVTDTDEIILSRYYIFDPFYVYYYNIEKNTITRVEIQGMDAFKHYTVHISLNHVEDVKLLQYVQINQSCLSISGISR